MEINDAIIKEKLDLLSEFNIDELKGMLIGMEGYKKKNEKLKEEIDRLEGELDAYKNTEYDDIQTIKELKEEVEGLKEESKILQNYREDMNNIEKGREDEIDDISDVLPYIQKLEKANKKNKEYINSINKIFKKMEDFIKTNDTEPTKYGDVKETE